MDTKKEKSIKEDTNHQEKSVIEKPKIIEKGINFAINEFEQKMNEDISESGLPISILRLVFEKIVANLKNAETFQVAQEKKNFIDAFKNVSDEGGKA